MASNGVRAKRMAAAVALTRYGFRAMNRLGYFQVLKCITISDPPAEFLSAEPRFECRILTPEELWRYSAAPEDDLPEAFLREALAKGDECYAILEGDTLASYGWYSSAPTAVEDRNLAIRFDEGWVYMYKGYTKREYRGLRLHAIGMARSLQAHRERGYRGIVSYVAANNDASLKSCYRMGYKDFGLIAIAKIRGVGFKIWHSPGCRAYGVTVNPR